MKTCTNCNQAKEESYFYKDKNRKDGFNPYCKECRKAKEDTLQSKEYKREWYNENKEKTLERSKKRSITHKNDVRGYKEKYYTANKTKIKQKSLQYYINNKTDPKFIAKRNETSRKWKQKNKHIIAWRSLLRTCLKKLGKKKTNSTIMMLGYSAEELRLHLENLWTVEMSWDNYGEWHIDHIKPIKTFQQDEDIKVVNALSNLRPLWATSRIINGVFYEGNLNRNKKC